MPALFMSAVAQLSTLPASTVALAVQKLPGAPLLEKVAFEQPWLLMGCLVAVGIAAMWFGYRQNKPRRGQLVLTICVALAGASLLSSMLVTTTREEIASLTKQTINFVLAGDSTSLEPMLRSDLVVYPFGMSRDRVLQEVGSSMRGRYAVKEHRLTELLVTQDSDVAVRSQVRLRATPSQQLYDLPVGSWWMLTWQRDATGNWLISRIECQQIDGVGNIQSIRP